MSDCPHNGEVGDNLPVVLRAQHYAQRLIDDPQSHTNTWQDVLDWTSELYGRPDDTVDADQKDRHDMLRLRRYVALTAFYSLADVHVAQVVDKLCDGSLTSDELPQAEAIHINYKIRPTALFAARFGGVANEAYASVLDDGPGCPWAAYRPIVEELDRLQPQFAASRLALYGYDEQVDFREFLRISAWDDGQEVMKALLDSARTTNAKDVAALAVHAVRNMRVMANMASVDRTTNNGDIDGRKERDGSPANFPYKLFYRKIVHEYESAVLEGRPLEPNVGYLTVRDGVVLDKRQALRNGPFNPSRLCVGYTRIKGPDGIFRQPVKTGLRLGILLASDTIYGTWPDKQGYDG